MRDTCTLHTLTGTLHTLQSYPITSQDIAQNYAPLRTAIGASYVPDASGSGLWRNNASMGFVAMVDACSSPSDSLLRWAAFSALACNRL